MLYQNGLTYHLPLEPTNFRAHDVAVSRSGVASDRLSDRKRGVAQLGSAPALGAGGPRFESGRPDLGKLDAVRSYRVGLFSVIGGGVRSGVKTYPLLLTQRSAHEPFASR